MPETILFLQDVQAIMDNLSLAFDGLTIPGTIPPLPLVNQIGHQEVESGTLCPYLIVIDAVSVPAYTFRNNISGNDGMYIIRPVTQDTDTLSAQTLAGMIHQVVFDCLQGKAFAVDGYPKPFTFRVGPREPTHWETIDSNTRYFHSGFKWLATDT